MTECGIVLRTLHRRAASMEDVCRRLVRHLYDTMGADGQRACVLVRAFKTHPYAGLDGKLQSFAVRLNEVEPAAETRCLTLIASAGVEPEWNSRHSSRSHRVIPLGSNEALQRQPMVARLVAQLGMEPEAVVQTDRSATVDLQRRTLDVFYVPEARGSPYVPAQDFVQRYGVRSVVGFGSVLPAGDLVAVILFARVHLPRETAELFRPLALAAKLALLPFTDGRVFDVQHA
jgi:two-component system, NtrC family, sensor kinase